MKQVINYGIFGDPIPNHKMKARISFGPFMINSDFKW